MVAACRLEKAESTRVAYRGDFTLFRKWCERKGVSALPASPATVAAFLAHEADRGSRAVRHGHGPQRAIQTGVGPVEIRRAKVRDRGDVSAEEKIRFTSSSMAASAAARVDAP
jgi:hypothetical protein